LLGGDVFIIELFALLAPKLSGTSIANYQPTASNVGFDFIPKVH